MNRFIVLLLYLCSLFVMSGINFAFGEPVEKIVQTEDGRTIVFDYYNNERDAIVILAHGFYNNKDTVLFQKLAHMFVDKYDVLCFDFRGHGKSDGVFEWTANEDKDLRAIVTYAEEQGYEKCGVIGFSLGAAIAILEASKNSDIDSVIAVSSPYDVWKIDYHFWEEMMLEDLKLNLGPKGKGKGIRPGNPFLEKVKPIEVVSQISPRPILFIHGRKDWLINAHHTEKLFKKAGEPKQLYIYEEAGHAEKIYDDFPDEFQKQCFQWFEKTL